MAHGFLAYTSVSGDNFWKNLKDVYKGLRDLAKLYDTGNKILKANVRELDPKQLAAGKPAALPSGAPKALSSAPATKMLGAGGSSIVGKNPTNIDVKTGERPESGPRLPGSTGGGPSKGGGFTDVPGIASSGLNTQNFFSKAVNEGIDVNTGQYLSREARIAAFKAGKVDRNTSQGPSISPDSGVDIVAAVNRNTQMIVSLVDAVKTQTQNDSKLTEQQIQTQETLMLRSAAAQKESALEQGGDYSGFMTPENFEKRKKNEKKKETGSKLKEFFKGPNPFKKDDCCGCGCSPFMPGPGGRGGPLGGAPGGGGLPIPDFVDEYRDMNRRRGSRLGGGGSVMRRGGGRRAITRAATKIGGKGLGKAVGKGLAKKIPGVGVLAGGAFAAERAMKGDWLGAGGELLSGIASIVPGLGTAVSAGIDAGLMARDAGLTPFATGGIITQPTASLMGEGNKAEGVFPLEGTRGKKTFKLFGEGIFAAQKNNESEYAKLQAKGFKQYFETEGGGKKLGETLKDFFKGLGGVFASLFGGAANAGTLDGAANYLNGGGGSGAPGAQSAGEAGLLKALRFAEGTEKSYGTIFGGNVVKELEQGELTVQEVINMADTGKLPQRLGGGAVPGYGKGSKATGAYQFMPFTLESLIKDGTLKPNEKFTNATQDKAALALARRRGVTSQMLNTEGFSQKVSTMLAPEWASLPTASGNSYYGQPVKSLSSLQAKFDAGKTAFSTQPLGGGGGNASIAAAAQSLKGMDTSGGPGGGSVSCVYAVNKVFDKAGVKPPWGGAQSTDAVINASKSAGWQQVGFGDAKPGDVWVYDANDGRTGHVGIMMPNGRVLSNSSSQAKFTWEADRAELLQRYPKNGMTPPGGIFFRAPGSGNIASPPGTGATPSTAATPRTSPRASSASSPGSLQASAASPNTGTPMMAASQQVAMGTMGLTTQGGGATIINNYYGGGMQGGVNANGVSPGIGMDGTGTSVFQELKIRALA